MVGSDDVSLLLYAAMKQFLSSSGIKSLNGSHAADLKLKLLIYPNKSDYSHIGWLSFVIGK